MVFLDLIINLIIISNLFYTSFLVDLDSNYLGTIYVMLPRILLLFYSASIGVTRMSVLAILLWISIYIPTKNLHIFILCYIDSTNNHVVSLSYRYSILPTAKCMCIRLIRHASSECLFCTRDTCIIVVVMFIILVRQAKCMYYDY